MFKKNLLIFNTQSATMATLGEGTVQQNTVTFMLEENLEKIELNETG